MRFAIDSNVLVYAFQRDDMRIAVADAIVRGLDGADVLLPVQVLGEVINVVRRKYPDRLYEAAIAVGTWSVLFPTAQTTVEDVIEALEVAERYRLQYWDSVIITVAARAGAGVLLTEDMQDGATVHGVRLVNPFFAANHALIDALLTPLPGTA